MNGSERKLHQRMEQEVSGKRTQAAQRQKPGCSGLGRRFVLFVKNLVINPQLNGCFLGNELELSRPLCSVTALHCSTVGMPFSGRKVL